MAEAENTVKKKSGGAGKRNKASQIFAKIKSVKHIEIILAAVAVAIILLIYFSSFFGVKNETADETQKTTDGDYCTAAVSELESKLSKVSGVGSITVLIHWGSSVEQILAESVTPSGGSNVVTVGGQVHVLKTVYPVPRGVIIICDGANNISVKMNLISAVSSYFGISENTITVLARA